MDYETQIIKEHVHDFDQTGTCRVCGMHREELFVNLSGVFPDEREETEYNPEW